MNINHFQKVSQETNIFKINLNDKSQQINTFLLGMAGEVGEILSEYKKQVRDGITSINLNNRINEELGDLLWYVAEFSSISGLSLLNIAENNLLKSKEMWSSRIKNKFTLNQKTSILTMDDYQKYSLETDITYDKNLIKDHDFMVILFGLAGEVGTLLERYKKNIRDCNEEISDDLLKEDLGDILWYISAIATRFELSLSDIASNNIIKNHDRWIKKSTKHINFDKGFPSTQCLPRKMTVEFITMNKSKNIVGTFINGKKFGSNLKDNALYQDDYRYHDIFHFSYVAVLGWSPVVRGLLKKKRKTAPKVDEVQDGGRAVVIDEGISALVFAYASQNNHLKNIKNIDYEILRSIKNLINQPELEVNQRSLSEWQEAILLGYKIWNKVREKNSGKITLDLNKQEMIYHGELTLGRINFLSKKTKLPTKSRITKRVKTLRQKRFR